MKKCFKVLEINNTESCVVENLETGEVISINEKTACGLRAEILDKVDMFELIVGDEFRI
jgi:hypothetical protein